MKLDYMKHFSHFVQTLEAGLFWLTSEESVLQRSKASMEIFQVKLSSSHGQRVLGASPELSDLSMSSLVLNFWCHPGIY